jgi:ferredoxin
MTHSKKKIIKEIHIHPDKCNGCRACEIACAAFHSSPKYNGFNPARSRIRMIINEINDEWVAVRSGSLNKTECKARSRYVINGKEYSECSFCSDTFKYWYLKFLFERLPEAMTEDDFRARLPYNVDKTFLAVPSVAEP